MGQRYLLVNKTKKQFVSGYIFQDNKAMEILANGILLKALGYLLMKSDDECDIDDNPLVGYWAGDEIVIIGEYDSSDLYPEARASYVDISSTVAAAMLKMYRIESVFENFIREDLQEGIDVYPPIPFDKLISLPVKIIPEPVQCPDPDSLELT